MNEEVRFARIAFYNHTDILQLSHVDSIIVVGTAGYVDDLAFFYVIADRNGTLSRSCCKYGRIVFAVMNSRSVCISRIISIRFGIRCSSGRICTRTDSNTAAHGRLCARTNSRRIIRIRNPCTPAHSRRPHAVRTRYISRSADSYGLSGFRIRTVTNNRTV